MAKMLCKTKGNANPKGKPRVYFTCHPEDFDRYFDKICQDIFKTHDCGIFYTEDMTAVIEEQDKATDLESNNLFVVPVTFRLLSQPNRAMDADIPFAFEKHIPVLPFMMEPGIDEFYSRPDKFGELQYLNPYSTDATEISYEEKLKKYLESVLISDEMAKRVRAAFDAYIFLSYRKKDRRYANELMRLIHSHPECRDIAIWFDEFLTPGESFKTNIEKALQSSKLFTLLVTPNLLEEPDGKPNFVMGEEYPAAKKSGIDILPAEMEETNKDTLSEKFEGIPQCIDPHDEAFKARLLESISKIATSENDDVPAHNFLIGLAYLEGIDVEVDREHAVSLITSAAEADLPEAMEKLIYMYTDGAGVKRNPDKAVKWSQRLAEYFFKKSFNDCGRIDNSKEICELFDHYKNPYWADVIRLFLLLADKHLDRAAIEELYGLLMSLGICEYTLLFDACKEMNRHKEETQIILVTDILTKSVDGTYPPYGPLFWYIPEYELYEVSLLALQRYGQKKELPESLSAQMQQWLAKAFALVRDVCFGYAPQRTAAQITNRVDTFALYKQAKLALSGLRAALCELFYLGDTDYSGGNDVFPRCFNVAEAKAFAKYNCGVFGVMHTPFQDELGLYAQEAYNELDGEYIGLLSCSYHVSEIEKKLTSRSCRKLRGLILSSTEEKTMHDISINSAHISRIYLPENAVEIGPDWTERFGSAMSMVNRGEKKMYVGEEVVYPVDWQELPEDIFAGCTGIRKITIPEGMTRIGETAFHTCTELISVCIPSTVTEIGSRAFCNCRHLLAIHIPDSVVKIEDYAFQGCTALQTVRLPASLDSICSGLFSECKKLSGIELPRSVTVIGNYAFSECTALTEVRLPESVTQIGAAAFAHTALTAIHIPDSVTRIEREAFYMCTALASVRLSKGISQIEANAFQFCADLRSIRIPEGVTALGVGVFHGCRNLTMVDIPDSVTEIGGFAFADCERLVSVRLPAGLHTKELSGVPFPFNGIRSGLGISAFSGCTGLTEITIPEGITELEENVFAGCTRLVSVYLPNGLQKIGRGAFSQCTSLASITVPDEVTQIWERAFQGCIKLNEVIVPNTTVVLPSAFDDGVLITRKRVPKYALSDLELPKHGRQIKRKAYQNQKMIRTVHVKDKVTRIGDFAFVGCERLEKLQLPDSVRYIGRGAFQHCFSLHSVHLPASLNGISPSMFLQCKNLTELLLPEKITVRQPSGLRALFSSRKDMALQGKLGKSAFEGCIRLENIRIPDGITHIQADAFKNCTALTAVSIPKSVTEIECSAFIDCSSLMSVEFPDSVSVIGGYAFYNCASLSELRIPYGVKHIFQNTFSRCTGLRQIQFSKGLEAIGQEAFSNCIGLDRIDLPDGLTRLEENAFSYCEGLVDIRLPDTLTSIGVGAFGHCKKVVSLNLPKGITRIGAWAFTECESLTSIRIPDGLKELEHGVFAQCRKLAHVYLPEGLTVLDNWTFEGCGSLTSIQFPSSLNVVGIQAFAHCAKLETVHFPKNTKIIGDGAFVGCSNLKDVRIPEGTESIEAHAFMQCEQLSQIHIPKSVRWIGKDAFCGCIGLKEITAPIRFEDELPCIFSGVDLSDVKIYWLT